LATGGLFFVENVHREMTARENIEMRNFSRLQRHAELKKQKDEIESAVLSLKTNLSLFLVLIFLFLSGVFLSSNVLALIFSLLKSFTPVVTCVINFVKIRALILNFCDVYFNRLYVFTNQIFSQ